MLPTKDWTPEHYLKHITDNRLDEIWVQWSNPKNADNVIGIRLNAYKPIFPTSGNVDWLDEPCKKIGCNGTLKIPLLDRQNKILNKKVCDGQINGKPCNKSDHILYRWLSRTDKRKLTFSSPSVVRNYGLKGRPFYSTLIIYDSTIVTPSAAYVNEALYKAATLGMDIDIKSGTIVDSANREDLQKALDYVLGILNTFAPGSYSLQTSGNGVYILLNHNLCTIDINNIMGMFNGWIRQLNIELKTMGITKIKIDSINMPSRVFKMMGSIHQSYDLVAIPLEYDVNLSKMKGDEFKLENFNINNYIVDNKLNYYNRYNPNERMSLYKFLETHSIEADTSGPRAIRYDYTDAIETTTGEEQPKTKHELTPEEIQSYYENQGWKKFDIAIPGRVYYRTMSNNDIRVKMFGVDKKDALKITDQIIQKNKKDKQPINNKSNKEKGG